MREIREALSKLKKKKTMGSDRIPGKAWKRRCGKMDMGVLQ